MEKIIIVKDKKRLSFIKYFIFTYLKCSKIFEKNLRGDILYIPYKKRLKKPYITAIEKFLKKKQIKEILPLEEEFKGCFNNYFRVINGINIYRTIFCDVLNFFAKNNLYEYEIVFISDNLKEIKELAQKCVKKVKSISVLTQKPFLYESMSDFFLSKYGVNLNIKEKKDKLKKNKKIYINAGANRVFEKNTFNNVNLIDIYNVYEGAYHDIILESTQKSKHYTKLLKCPYNAALAEFINEQKNAKNIKIVNIKK